MNQTHAWQLHDAKKKRKKKEPEAITTEKNSSFLKYTTSTVDDRQLG
jgi:hypothetical protein